MPGFLVMSYTNFRKGDIKGLVRDLIVLRGLSLKT